MNQRLAILIHFAVLAALCLTANAQSPGQKLKHFAREGLSFDYPADYHFDDKSGPSGQTLELANEEHAAQIMVISRYEVINSPEQLAKAQREVTESFVETLTREFKSQQAQIERSESRIEVGGAQASGVHLRAVLADGAVNSDVYSLLLGQRLVVLSFIGPDKPLEAAASAWAIVRRSLKVEARTDLTVSAPAEVVASGTLTGSTYENRYFGLTLTVPAGWHAQDSSVKQQIIERGKELVTSDDPAKRAELKRAADNTLNLLTVSEYPVGGSEPFNPMILCGAERIASSVVKDTDYMIGLKQTLRYSRMTISLARDAYSQTLGGVEFSVIDLAIDYQGVTVNQRYYAHIRKGYALFFIVVYQTNEQLKTGTEILRSVVLR